jgi:hypothetical protein
MKSYLCISSWSDPLQRYLDLMGKGIREDGNERRRQITFNHLDDLLNVKGYVNGIITANKILYCSKR